MEINSSHMIYSDKLHNLIDNTLLKPGERAKIAEKVGVSLQKAEDNYLAAVSKKDAEPGELAKAEMVYKRVLHVYESFMQMMNAAFQTMRAAVNRLDIR